MKEYSKKATFGIIIGVYALCDVVKYIEFLVLKTDRTVIAENIICKLFIIVMLMTVLALSGLSWKRIVFITYSSSADCKDQKEGTHDINNI